MTHEVRHCSRSGKSAPGPKQLKNSSVLALTRPNALSDYIQKLRYGLQADQLVIRNLNLEFTLHRLVLILEFTLQLLVLGLVLRVLPSRRLEPIGRPRLCCREGDGGLVCLLHDQ